MDNYQGLDNYLLGFSIISYKQIGIWTNLNGENSQNPRENSVLPPNSHNNQNPISHTMVPFCPRYGDVFSSSSEFQNICSLCSLHWLLLDVVDMSSLGATTKEEYYVGLLALINQSKIYKGFAKPKRVCILAY